MILKSFKLVLVLLLATGLDARQRQQRRTNKSSQVKRQATPRAPLSSDELLILSSFDSNSISDWSYYYTHGLHVAGTNRSQAQWTADHFSQWGWTSSIATYNVFLNYPINKSIGLTYPDGSVFTPKLEEAVLPVDPTTGYPNRVPTFHGYSASGAVAAEYVYVGRGQDVDYDRVGTVPETCLLEYADDHLHIYS